MSDIDVISLDQPKEDIMSDFEDLVAAINTAPKLSSTIKFVDGTDEQDLQKSRVGEMRYISEKMIGFSSAIEQACIENKMNSQSGKQRSWARRAERRMKRRHEALKRFSDILLSLVEAVEELKARKLGVKVSP